MVSNPIVWPAIAVIGLGLQSGCHSSSTPSPERCGPAVPASAQHPISARAGTLAGDYQLIQVQTQPKAGKTSVGRLHLAALDSVSRAHAVGGAVRDLASQCRITGSESTWCRTGGRPSSPGRLGYGRGACRAPDDHRGLTRWFLGVVEGRAGLGCQSGAGISAHPARSRGILLRLESRTLKTSSPSAGILLFRQRSGALEIFLAHPGGPFWQSRDKAGWTIPKGLAEEGEDLLAAARREFEEETGIHPSGPFIPLGAVRQKAGKVVYAWAWRGEADPSRITSNSTKAEWPRGSGRWLTFPEVDRCDWFSHEQAREKINPAQAEFIDRLEFALSSEIPPSQA
jgi:predicted NUDIX family NTP pyrophosphohydrolase